MKTTCLWMMMRAWRMTSRSLLMTMAPCRRVGRSQSINADRKMITKVATSDADAGSGIFRILRSTLTSKLNTMVRHLKARTLHSFRLAVVEEDQGRLLLIMKRGKSRESIARCLKAQSFHFPALPRWVQLLLSSPCYNLIKKMQRMPFLKS